VLHALPDPEQGPTSGFEAQHNECLEHHKALVIQLDAAHELMLAPVCSAQGDGSVVPVFWGYVLCPGMASVAFGLLERRQMALIFDLDETLVVAHTLSTAESRRDECIRSKENMLQMASQETNMEERQHFERMAGCLQKEADMLNFDAELLNQYAMSNQVRTQKGMFTPRLESVVMEDGSSIQRPVIRLRDGQVILTRIHPHDRKSSVIVRVRPGWKELHSFLAGMVDSQQRFEVYACTAAERQYALEVWRLLDSNAALIPVPLRRQRIVNVGAGRLKTLPNSFGLLPFGEEALGPLAGAAGEEQPPMDVSRQMPLAVVVDDRTVVWEQPSRPQILQVIPWAYYRDEAARLMRVDMHTAAASERELTRVRNAIVQVSAYTAVLIPEASTLPMQPF